MKNNYIKVPGVILFDPENATTKHEKHSEWKKVAMVMIDGDIHHYYRWLLKKRYNLKLQPPLRGAHISFINDRAAEMNGQWEKIKEKWDGKKVEVILSVDPRSDGDVWWLNIPEEYRQDLHSIRAELGLGRPHWGLHMTIGSAVNHYSKIEDLGQNVQKALGMHEEHSQYIVNLIRNGYCD